MSDQVLSLIVWGNADPALGTLWGRVIWACAVAGDGVVDTPSGPQTGDEFARSAGLFPS